VRSLGDGSFSVVARKGQRRNRSHRSRPGETMRAVSPLPDADLRLSEPSSGQAVVLRNTFHDFVEHDSRIRRRKEFSRKGPVRDQDQGSFVDR